MTEDGVQGHVHGRASRGSANDRAGGRLALGAAMLREKTPTHHFSPKPIRRIGPSPAAAAADDVEGGQTQNKPTTAAVGRQATGCRVRLPG